MDLKERIKLIDERALNLFKRYPIVGLAVFLAGVVTGAIVVMVL